MHLEILVEDSSGAKLLEFILPKLIGGEPALHTWRVHSYKGIGRLPRDLTARADPSKRILLEQLPRLLGGLSKSAGIDAILVVLDLDRRDCRDFLRELASVAHSCGADTKAMFRLAIEEIEAWYLGDRNALLKAYPRAKAAVLRNYNQDSTCGTWEVLADAIHPGGAAQIKKRGWPLPGQLKHDWAEKIGPFMNVDENRSPSFSKFRDGLRRLTTLHEEAP